MTTITLPPDLEGRLADEARRRGTTPELLAVDGLRQLFAPPPANLAPPGNNTLFDFLAGHIGVLSSSEHVPGGARMSENGGKKFAEGLLRKREQGRL